MYIKQISREADVHHMVSQTLVTNFKNERLTCWPQATCCCACFGFFLWWHVCSDILLSGCTFNGRKLNKRVLDHVDSFSQLFVSDFGFALSLPIKTLSFFRSSA